MTDTSGIGSAKFNPDSNRFQPAYINPFTQSLTTRSSVFGIKARRDKKRRYYDATFNEFISERTYVRRSEGWSKESKAKARREGFLTLADKLVGHRNPTLVLYRRQQNLVDRFQQSASQRGEYLTRSQILHDADFQAAIAQIREYEQERLRLIRAGRRGSAEYIALTSPDGPYAGLLVYLGLRDSDANYAVGDSP